MRRHLPIYRYGDIMSVTAASLRKSGRYRAHQFAKQVLLQPGNLKELQSILQPDSQYIPPFRPMGGNSSATDCNTCAVGTIIDMTSFDAIMDIDHATGRVTVQAGVRLGQLSAALAAHDLELDGSHDFMNRTVGGAVAGGCIGPSIGIDSGLFSAQVISMKAVTPLGELLNVDGGKESLLNAFRLSYGMLGVIYQVTLRVRPIKGFVANHRRCSLPQFSNAVEKLVRTNIGMKFIFLPFRDVVYLDLRRYNTDARTTTRIPWKLKRWAESTLLPRLFKFLNRAIPVSAVRYRLIDQLFKMTQKVVSNRLVSSGSMANAQSVNRSDERAHHYSTWCFPATDASIVIPAYRDFCHRIKSENGFRCDMPTVGYLVGRDRSSILSPSFDESMIALCAMSTQAKGWDNFAIDFADFAKHWGGSPVFNQTREVDPEYVKDVFGTRLDYFRKVRRRIDAERRMMNPFLSQYFL
jgi:L-gulonolactone oxidase